MTAPTAHPSSTRTSVYYEHIRVSGLPRERGRQYGCQAAAKIRQNIKHYLQPGQLPPWDQTVEYIHNMYIPGLKSYFPSAFEEMKGIAEGANVSVEEIVMLNARYDLSRAPGGSRYRPPPGAARQPASYTAPSSQPNPDCDWDDLDNECTSSAFWGQATTDGIVYTAQNWDISSHLYVNDLVILLEVHPDPSEGIPSMFLVTEAGQMGRSGMNSAGLGLTANSLNSTADYFPTDSTPRLPISLLRRMFLQGKSFPQGLQAVNNAPRHVSNNLTLSTAEGFALCMELTPNEAFVVSPSVTDRHIIHANHFLTPEIHARTDIKDSYPGGSSWYRPVQFGKGIYSYLDGRVDVGVITRAFSDHLGYPQSLCQHVDTSGGNGLPGYPFKKSMTVACVVYDLSRKVITVCKGQPCQGVFEEFRLDP